MLGPTKNTNWKVRSATNKNIKLYIKIEQKTPTGEWILVLPSKLNVCTGFENQSIESNISFRLLFFGASL